MATIGSVSTFQPLPEEKEHSAKAYRQSYTVVLAPHTKETILAQERTQVFLKPPKSGGRPITVEYEPNDAVWDEYGDLRPQATDSLPDTFLTHFDVDT